MKRQALQQEKEEDERIRQHGERKERVAEMRRLREEFKFQEKQAQRQKMIDA